MSSVSRDARDGRWLARWRDPAGRQRKKSFRRKLDAQRWLDQLNADRHRGQYIDPAGAKVTVGMLAEAWSKGLTHLKPSTANRYRGIVRTYVMPKWGGWQLGRIGHSDVAEWVSALSGEGLAPGSVRQVHRVFSLILDDAVFDGRIARNPAKRVKLPRQVREEPRFLSGDELAALVAACRDGGHVVAVLGLTGLRFGELAGLRVRRVNFLRRRLEVVETLTEVGGRVVVGTPKTHQHRSVPFPRQLGPRLTELCKGHGADDYVFRAPEGGPLRLRNWRRTVFDPACSEAGIVGLSPHDLRHTAASLAIAAGANVKAVQSMLGHSSAAMTLDVYAGLFGDDLDAVADALDRLVPQMGHTAPNRAAGDPPARDAKPAG